MKNYLIAESVSRYHPDKICDQISDLLLDEYIKQDEDSRVAIETVGGHGQISLYGEITSKVTIDHEKIVKDFYRNLVGKDITVKSNLVKQSKEIANGVDKGGAGDQGIMIGYACRDNEEYIPQEIYLARKLLEGVKTDAKSQVVISHGEVRNIVLSIQNLTKKQIIDRVKNLVVIDSESIFANNTGEFTFGGFDADAGCTGRKIVVDSYGPRVQVGGGAFSGKDPTKVDRSGAYMARYIALQLLHKHSAKEVYIKIGYVIGGVDPVYAQARVDGKNFKINYDLRPKAIIETLNLKKPIYLDTAINGHFGRIDMVSWEKFE